MTIRVVHNHGRACGLARDYVWHDIDGRPHGPVTKVWVPRWLYAWTEFISDCPGGEEHVARHRADHARWRERNGLEPRDG